MGSLPATTANLRILHKSFSQQFIDGEISAGGYEWEFRWQFGNGELTARHEGTLSGTYKVQLTEKGKKHPLFFGISESPSFHFANSLHILPSIDQKNCVLATHDNSPALAIDHGNNWFSTQFHPESIRELWDIYYSKRADKYKSKYSDNHEGKKFISNFFSIT